MELRELKDKLLNNDKINLPLTFINLENNFLVNSYIDKIAQNINKQTKRLNSLEELNSIKNNLFYINYLFILELNNDQVLNKETIGNDLNLIIIYSKDVDTDIEKVIFTPLEKWQIEDYVSVSLPGVSKENILWLCNNFHYDMFKLKNEIVKIKIFNKVDQEYIFNKIYNDKADLTNINNFSFANTIVKKDLNEIKTILEHYNELDINNFSIIAILINQFHNMINVMLNKQANAYKLNLSEAQFKAIRINSNRYPNDKLINIYQKLNSMDFDLKSGFLDLSPNYLILYLINQIV